MMFPLRFFFIHLHISTSLNTSFCPEQKKFCFLFLFFIPLYLKCIGLIFIFDSSCINRQIHSIPDCLNLSEWEWHQQKVSNKCNAVLQQCKMFYLCTELIYMHFTSPDSVQSFSSIRLRRRSQKPKD